MPPDSTRPAAPVHPAVSLSEALDKLRAAVGLLEAYGNNALPAALKLVRMAEDIMWALDG